MNKLKHHVIYWFPVYIYVILIFYLSSLPNPISVLPGMIRPIFMDLSHIIYHIIEYLILAILLYRALVKTLLNHNAIFCTLILVIAYGITDEIHQLFVPSRVFSFLDILSNSFGAIVLQSLVYIKNSRRFKRIFSLY